MLLKILNRVALSLSLRTKLALSSILCVEQGSLSSEHSAAKVCSVLPAENISAGRVQGFWHDRFENEWSAFEVFQLHKAHLVGPRAAVLTRLRRLVTEQLYGSGQIIREQAASHDLWLLIIASLKYPICSLESAFSINSPYAFNYYHWLTDCLPSLMAYEALSDALGERPMLLVPSGRASWQSESLERLGFTGDNFIDYQGPHIAVERLYIPTWHKGSILTTAPSPLILCWMRNRFFSTLNHSFTSGAECIFVDRSRSRRPIANADAFRELFQHHGFQSVQLEELTFGDQLQLFHSARVVAGLHGAGFANILFMKQPQLFEVFIQPPILPYFRELSQVLGGRYGCHLATASVPAVSAVPAPTVQLKPLEAALVRFLNS